ncbi:MAG: polymer-forming cytoskeletal protein [Lachnospiraceae bacterium]|nr:polymer-forming cytoskeletal protein [Lachnospiraceae bacterium]
MGFFKEFKEDFSDAVDEIVPDQQEETVKDQNADDVMVNTLDDDVDVDSELSKLDGLLETVAKKVDTDKTVSNNEENVSDKKDDIVGKVVVETPVTTVKSEDKKTMAAEEPRITNTVDTVNTKADFDLTNNGEVSDETAEITAGMTITGDLESTGSINVEGTVKGNVKCNGKLVVTGTIHGNSASSEFFADAAKVEGEVVTSGTAKVGAGAVIIGNITAASAVIAGAVKGDIDVQGPVVVDTSAVVMGNIKSRSVQINNGAVIEGFCSQAYADVDVESVFTDAV